MIVVTLCLIGAGLSDGYPVGYVDGHEVRILMGLISVENYSTPTLV